MNLVSLLLLTLGSDLVWTTPHFEIHYQPGQTSLAEVQAVAERSEVFYQRLEEYLGRSPSHRIVISLEGDRRSEPPRYPYVDTDAGWMHLFRFPEDTYPYQMGLSHELVHAFRFEHLSSIEMPPPPAFVFTEEGLAEYLSQQIEPHKQVFPSYSFELDVIAGQWLDSDQYIPLCTLLNEQWRLRPKCIAQAYTEQPSFIAFIETELGREKIRQLAYASDLRDEEILATYLGGSFATWVSNWEAALRNRYRQIPNHEDLGRQWLQRTPIGALYVCRRGADF